MNSPNNQNSPPSSVDHIPHFDFRGDAADQSADLLELDYSKSTSYLILMEEWERRVYKVPSFSKVSWIA